MKRTLILLSLFAVPAILTSCKCEAATPSPDNTASVAESAKSPAEATLLRIEKIFKIMGVPSSIGIRAGFEGKTAEMEKLSEEELQFFCLGAALAGRTELVMQCIDSKDESIADVALGGAAVGEHMELVHMLLEQGADPARGLMGAALGGHMGIVQLMLEKGPRTTTMGLPVLLWMAIWISFY